MTPNPSENELKLFPLHPENLVGHLSRELEDKDIAGNVAWFLDSDGDATMNGLLGSSSVSDDDPSSTAFVHYGKGPEDNSDGPGDLALTALRHRGREMELPEQWVFFPRVVVESQNWSLERENVGTEEEACSSNSSGSGGGGFWCCTVKDHQAQQQGLLLKLDYEEVLNAWSDKGSLFIEGECPHTVPRQDDDFHMADLTNVGAMEIGCGRNVASWMMVPEGGGCGTEGKLCSREARVLRYKEKRQSRLFSKRIRYEVRKLNAEKRPRNKGRFVKRVEGFYST